MFFNEQTDRQTDIFGEKKDTQTLSVVFEFQFNRFISFRISKNGFFGCVFAENQKSSDQFYPGYIFQMTLFSFFQGYHFGLSNQ